MQFIRGPEQARGISDPAIRRLVQERYAEVCNGEPYDADVHGEMIVVQERDTLVSMEEETGLPIATNPFDGARFPDLEFVPVWEWIENHNSCFVCTFVLTDSGGGTSLFVPKHSGIDADLLALCARFAVPVPEVTP